MGSYFLSATRTKEVQVQTTHTNSYELHSIYIYICYGYKITVAWYKYQGEKKAEILSN